MTKRIDLSRYIVISTWFGCNNRCTICMLPDRGHLPPIGFERFQSALVQIRKSRRFDRLILSGAEVTTQPDLLRYIRFAAGLGFDRIQIQTNGRRLADPAVVESLVEAGVNEFFVSLYGRAPAHDAVAGTAGAYRETMAGLGHLAAFNVNVITNTVLIRENMEDLPHLARILINTSASEMHLWNFFPMGLRDDRHRLVSLDDLQRLLPRLTGILRPAGRPLVVKAFPECLFIEAPGVFDSRFPETLLPDRFWQEFAKNRFGSCPHRDRCRNTRCWGLSAAYIARFGDERGRLCPMTG